MFFFWMKSKLKNTADILKNMADNNHIALTETSICLDIAHKVVSTSNNNMMALTTMWYRTKYL